jgi:alpha-L-fucosidase
MGFAVNWFCHICAIRWWIGMRARRLVEDWLTGEKPVFEFYGGDMKLTRRAALGAMAAGFVAGGIEARRVLGQAAGSVPEIEPGPFKGTHESLSQYKVPDWYRDAKFGIWAHWGPQSAAEAGDWYARNMYIQGNKQYDHHVKTYGHPTKFGYMDVIATWKADKFDPEHLMDLYVKAGAKYFCSMGVHHDNFDMWDSTYQPRWNAAKAGPKKDIVGLWRDAARKRGLRFAVSEHLSNSYNWFSTSHGSDKTGPLAGVSYDGVDPKFADLYHALPADYKISTATGAAMSRNAPDSWKQLYFKRIKELVDKYQPDLLYTDGGIPFGDYGLALVANHYNQSAKRNGGIADGIYTSKARQEAEAGMCILDLERGVAGGIPAQPWQTDTCIGSWHYSKGATYKTPKRVIDMLVDIVSRNGNLMLNFPLPNSGMLDDQELNVLSEITKFMATNSEGIYGTRPWTSFGEGPVASALPGAARGGFNETSRKDFAADEVRFTTKGLVLYAFAMGWPRKQAVIKSLATGAPKVGKIADVQLLGAGAVKWSQDAAGLTVQMPDNKLSDHAIALKVTGAI